MAELSKKLKNWEKTRELGFFRFVLIYGVLFWGLTTGIAWAVIMSLMSGWETLPQRLGVACILFPIGGLFFGIFTWLVSERAFHRATSAKP